jgi:ribonuclease Z
MSTMGRGRPILCVIGIKTRSVLFEITFLGTSAAAPSIHRSLSAQVVSFRDHRFLLDCGEGTQRQILRSGIGFRRLNRILITHGHLDHILGLGGLLSTFARWEALEHLEIWGGRRALKRIRDLIFGVVFPGNRPPLRIELIPVEAGVIIEEDGFVVRAFPVTHRGPDVFGYSFEESARRPFLPEKAEELGVPAGPVRRELVQGNSIQLPDGREINADQVLGTSRPGARLAFVGDCGRTDDILEACRGADALVIEATYLEYERELADRFGHLTARQAAELASEAKVGHLYLTHLSRRYREGQTKSEAAEVFPQVTVARDFDQFQIRRPA